MVNSPGTFKMVVYRSLTTHKKAGVENLPKYGNLSLINQKDVEEKELSLQEINFSEVMKICLIFAPT